MILNYIFSLICLFMASSSTVKAVYNKGQIIEYLIPFPATVNEFKVGQRYMATMMDRKYAEDGNGVEVIVNEKREGSPFEKSTKFQYTFKSYIPEKRLPDSIKKLAPTGSLNILETSYNAYPKTTTLFKNDYMKDGMYINLTSIYTDGPCKDTNVFDLNDEELKMRQVEYIDIVNDKFDERYYDASMDPALVRSKKLDTGPLTGNWQEKSKKMMCVHKLLLLDINWRMLDRMLENTVKRNTRFLLQWTYRRAFCLADDWYDLSLDDVTKLEDQTKQYLEQLLKQS